MKLECNLKEGITCKEKSHKKDYGGLMVIRKTNAINF